MKRQWIVIASVGVIALISISVVTIVYLQNQATTFPILEMYSGSEKTILYLDSKQAKELLESAV